MVKINKIVTTTFENEDQDALKALCEVFIKCSRGEVINESDFRELSYKGAKELAQEILEDG